MEKTNLLTLVVTLTVGIILAGSLLMPVLSDATTTEKTFVNTGTFNLGVFTPDDEYTLTFDSSDGVITVNDVEVPAFDTLNKSFSIISTDNFLARYGSNPSAYFLQCIGKDSSNIFFADSGVTVTITITSGNLSINWVKVDSTSFTKTVSFTEMYAIVPTVDEAVMKASADVVYIKGDSEIYASGLTNVTAWNNMFHFEGNYKDGITISSPSLPSATYDNIEWNIEAVSGYVDLYKLTSIEFDITNSGTTVHATYSFFGVPEKVTAELSQHLDAGEIALLNALPVIVIIGLVLAGVGAIFIRNRD